MRRPGLLSARSSFTLAVLCLIAATTGAARAATAIPGLRIESRYDDNIDQQAHGVGDVATLLHPDLWLGGRDETTRWELQARRSFISYSRKQDLFPQSDRASVAFDRRPSEVSSLALSYRFSRSRDPLTLEPLTSPRQGSLSRSSASVGGTTWRGEAELRFNRWSYEGSDLKDGESRYWEVSGFPARSPAGVWLATYRGNDLRIGGRSVLTSDVGLFGWRRTHTRRLRSRVQLGLANVNPKDGGATRQELAALVDVTGSLSPYGSPGVLHLRYGHDIASTALVELTRDWPFFSGAVRWARVLDVEGGIYRDPTLTERWGLAVADTLNGKVLAIKGSYGRTRPLRAGGTRAKVTRASVSLTVPLLPWLNQQTQFEFVQQGGLDPGDAVDFRRSRIGMSLEARLN